MSDAAQHVVRLAPFFVGWAIGWMLLARPRPLPARPERRVERAAVSVIIPARNESAALTELLPAIVPQLRAGDQLVVVDDASLDDTATLAGTFGATVLSAPPLPRGWLGKPNACWHGAQATTAPTVVFLDADVRPGPDLLAQVAAAVNESPASVISVQPWHRMVTAAEQLSTLPSITALMAVGRFSIVRTHPRVAFGPVLAMRRDVYERVGGHAHPSVRAQHTEDIALARLVGSSELYTGGADVSFRMYPDGLTDLVRGWTRSLAAGATSAPLWAVIGVIAWVWSLAGGWLVEPLVYPLSAVQLLVIGRRAGDVRWWLAALYPLAVLVFVVIVVRSLLAFVFRRDVRWKGRDVPAR